MPGEVGPTFSPDFQPAAALPFEAAGALEPSLFQEARNLEVEIIPGSDLRMTIEEAIKLCPYANDPTKMTPDAVDRFTAKILASNNIELPDRFSHLRPQPPATERQRSSAQTATPGPTKRRATTSETVSSDIEAAHTAEQPEPPPQSSTEPVTRPAATQPEAETKTTTPTIEAARTEPLPPTTDHEPVAKASAEETETIPAVIATIASKVAEVLRREVRDVLQTDEADTVAPAATIAELSHELPREQPMAKPPHVEAPPTVFQPEQPAVIAERAAINLALPTVEAAAAPITDEPTLYRQPEEPRVEPAIITRAPQEVWVAADLAPNEAAPDSTLDLIATTYTLDTEPNFTAASDITEAPSNSQAEADADATALGDELYASLLAVLQERRFEPADLIMEPAEDRDDTTAEQPPTVSNLELFMAALNQTAENTQLSPIAASFETVSSDVEPAEISTEQAPAHIVSAAALLQERLPWLEADAQAETVSIINELAEISAYIQPPVATSEQLQAEQPITLPPEVIEAIQARVATISVRLSELLGNPDEQAAIQDLVHYLIYGGGLQAARLADLSGDAGTHELKPHLTLAYAAQSDDIATTVHARLGNLTMTALQAA